MTHTRGFMFYLITAANRTNEPVPIPRDRHRSSTRDDWMRPMLHIAHHEANRYVDLVLDRES